MDEALIQEQERQLQKTGRYYKHVFWLCVPLLCMACYFYGARPLLLCGIALLTGNLCDRLVALLRHRVYTNKDLSNESFSLIIALLMPATVDIYVLVVAVLAGVLIGKEVFGGYGSYPFNPAAVGYAVAAVSWPEQVVRYPQPYTPLPLWNASAVPVSSTIEDTLRSGGILNLNALAVVLGEFAAPMGTGAALVILACGLVLWTQKDVHIGASASFLITCGSSPSSSRVRWVWRTAPSSAACCPACRASGTSCTPVRCCSVRCSCSTNPTPAPITGSDASCTAPGGCCHHGLPLFRRVRDRRLLCTAGSQQRVRAH